MRAEHERFLAVAMAIPQAYPRIPTKAVRSGGYNRLMATPSGRERAGQWWGVALDRVPR
jgi:hypothetical protein